MIRRFLHCLIFWHESIYGSVYHWCATCGKKWKRSKMRNFMIFAWFFIILTCTGMIFWDSYASENRKKEHSEKLMELLKANGNEFKILSAYSTYNGKGRYQGHVIIAEGVKNGRRI